ncbi:hypothetical protein QQF64_030493, partial [Cirrhinus molitorella]
MSSKRGREQRLKQWILGPGRCPNLLRDASGARRSVLEPRADRLEPDSSLLRTMVLDKEE